MRWIAAAALLLAVVAVDARQHGSAAADNRRRAVEILDAALQAAGGVERLSSITTVSLNEVGEHQWPHQSATARPPWRRGERTEETVLDRRNDRLFIDTRVSRPGYYFGWPGTIINGASGVTLDHYSKMSVPIPRPLLENYRAHFYQRFPHEILLDARQRNGSLRTLGEGSHADRRHDVLTYVAYDGRQTALYIDRETRLLAQYEQLFTDPVTGDSVGGVRFSGYRAVDAVQVPAEREQYRGASWTIRTKYQGVSFNAPVDAAKFMAPSDYDAVPLQPQATPSVANLGNGVYFLSGLTASGRYNLLFVEFADHLVVINAPTPSAASEDAFARITAAVPDKPIRAVVLTHPAYDHIAGARAFVAHGATVVSGAETRAMIEQSLAAPFSIEPDLLARSPRAARFEDAGRRRTFSDGSQQLQIIDIGPDETGRDVLIAYVPSARLVFQADLVNPNYAGAIGKAQPAAIMLERRFRELGLDVARIAGGHGGVITREELQRSVAR